MPKIPLLLLYYMLASCLYLPAQPIQRFDVVIHELMPDPDPVVGLPASEFVELKNISAATIDLRGWALSDGSSTARIGISFLLAPGALVIICSAGAAPAFRPFGPVIGVSNFPSLGNEKDTVRLLGPSGNIVHAVAYNSQWYRNDVKSNGGWSLEMIDAHQPCQGSSNWKASTDPSGGTPGRNNAVEALNPDEMPPALLDTYSIDSLTIIARFDEPVDSTLATQVSNYTIGPEIGHPIEAIPLPPLFQEVLLKLPKHLQQKSVYSLNIRSLTDCAGNPIGIRHSVKAGLASAAGPATIVFNEILFNPPPGGDDYLELFNRGPSVIDLQQLYIANRSPAGNLSNLRVLNLSPQLFFPGEYFVFTANARWLRQQFLLPATENIIELSGLPSMPDDRGAIVLANTTGEIIDELHYQKQWHFPLIAHEEGVALERIDPNQPTQQAANWSSAAATTGYGTPGYRNSQYRAAQSSNSSVSLHPTVFSPDNDGQDDFTFLQYRLASPGQMGTITVFDIRGYPVRYLAKNVLLSSSGQFRWDGLDEQGSPLPMGPYIVYVQIFDLQGRVTRLKKVVILVKKR